MPWEKVDLEEWADELGVNLHALRQKDRLIDQIVTTRKQLNLTQMRLAQLVGVSQPRIAQIETRAGIGKIKFDVLFKILDTLGYDYQITTRKVREPNLVQ